jgi:hypothetical protein
MRKNRMLSVANAAAVLALVSGPAMATSCTSTFALTSSQILSLLNPSGNQSCVVSACSGAGTNTWQQLGSPDDNETIVGGLTGSLYDYKQGPSHGVDPSAQVGTYGISGSPAAITYTYTGGSPYSFEVIPNTGTANTTSGSHNGSPGSGTVTLHFNSVSNAPTVGGVVIVSGVSPSFYNGTFTVTGSSTTSVQYTATGTGNVSTNGSVQFAISTNNYTFCQTSPTAGATYSVKVATGAPP